MKLGILDYCWQSEGQTSTARLAEAVTLAEIADNLGYSRYWLPEHHGSGGTAHSCPETVTPVLAARTRHIRVGPAGVLLRFYSPYKVAEVFRCLEAMFPGRIDLGLGRGGDNAVGRALLDGQVTPAANAYDRKTCDLVGMLRNDLPEEHPFHNARAMPDDVTEPQVWVLGSGESSAPLAGSLGVSFGFGLFFGAKESDGIRTVGEYRRMFRPTPATPSARAAVALAGVCAPTKEEAERLAARHTNPFIKPTVVGTPRDVRAEFERLSEAFGTDEIVFAQLGSELPERARAYELLAKECGLAPPEKPAKATAPRVRA